MSPEDQTTERLNAAIDALIRGAPLAEACAGLPPELHPLAAAGARLAALRTAAPDGPRPAFLLSLEEQLRADLRLGQGDPPSDPPPPPLSAGPAESPTLPPSLPVAQTWVGRGIVVGLVLAGLAGLYRGAEHAGPSDTLYPAKRAIEAIRLFTAYSPEDKAQVCLDVGWRRLEEAGQALRSGRTTDLAEMVHDMTTAYTLALTFAERSEDRRMANLAQSEAELAVGELARLAAHAEPRSAALLRNVNLVLSGTGKGRKIVAVTAPSAAATAGPTQVAAAPPASTVPASPTFEPTAPGVPTSEATAPPAASPSPELPPGPNASATPPATARPPASPTPPPTAPPTTTVAAPPTATRIKPKPEPPTATHTPAPPESTRTPKPWATELQPSPTAPPPRPSATSDPSREPPPTEEPSAEPPTAAPPPGPGQP